MGVRKKRKGVKSVKRRVRIKPLPGVGDATSTLIEQIETESRPL